eukprot:CAMPEP_0170077580 /NCGR_PEP_ID=MMETSP0019_2-20121128/14361_1 /TAXON_ID=98059 /ORGANISM="Dinobryon sp., Strain UTEXLB2267" /LENGTH=94 /DNA_ID=CAMNT_0010289979 /DNA_START=173 /DNA_END=457 /DNA_ORIENTATION=+
MLIIPDFLPLAMNTFLGKWTIRIMTIWNLLSFSYVFAKSLSSPVLTCNGNSQSSGTYAYQPLEEDVEMCVECAPAAIVVYDHENMDENGSMDVV